MEKTSFKKIFLVICIIMTLLAPSICADIVYAVDENVQDEVKEEIVDENTITNEVNDETSSDEEEPNTAENTNTIPKKAGEESNSENEAVTGDTPVTESETEQETQVMAISQEAIPLQEQEIALTSDEIKTVEPGVGTLQTAIANAKPGAVLQLKVGDYTGGDIVIDKDITIRGSGYSAPDSTDIIPTIIIKDTDNTPNNVYLENFAGQSQPPKNGFKYIDIQSTVNLNMNNITIFHILRDSLQVDKIQSDAIRIGQQANGSTVNIKNSRISTTYEGIVVDNSSNNTINIDNTTLEGRIAFKLENGNGNKINVENNSKVSGRSGYSAEDEAISIIAKQNLDIKVKDSNIIGIDAKGNVPTHLFSFDGERTSSNVKISITGNSSVEDKYGDSESSIFNFGKSNTPNNSNSIYVEKDVKMNPSTIARKYNTDTEYAMVGIFDKNGNLTVKAYDKGSPISEIENLPETLAGCTWEKKVGDATTAFNITDEVTENMDLYPIMPIMVDVHFEGQTYEIKEGRTFKDLCNLEPELQKKVNEIKSNEKFSRFIDGDGEEIKEETAFVKETTIIPKYKVKITIVNENSEDDYELEDGQFFRDVPGKEDKYEKKDKKRFVKYVEVDNDENTVDNSTVIDKDIKVKPVYEVDVMIKEEKYTLQEGQTLNDLSEDQKQKIEELVAETSKRFRKEFTNTENEKVDYDTAISKHTTLTPKYNVKVIIEKFGGNIMELDEMPEDTTIQDVFGSEKISEIEKFVKVDGKIFEKFENEEGVTVEYTTAIKKDTKLLAVYRDEVNITIKGTEDKTYTVKTGANLNSLGENIVKEIKNLVEKPNKSLSHFVDGDGNIVDFTTSLQKETTLTPAYKITVTVKPKYDTEQSFDMPEGDTLNTLNNQLKQFEEKDNKKFLRYTNESDNSEIKKDNKYNENITIVPQYEIIVKVSPERGSSKDITVNEGSTLDTMENELKDFEDNVKDKIFVNYVYENQQKVEEETVFKENTTIIPKYDILITVQKTREDETTKKEYRIPEGAVLNRITEEQMSELKTFVEDSTKVFADSFVDIDNNEVDMYTELYKNTTLIPKYNVKIEIVKPDGTKKDYLIVEGQNLNFLGDVTITEIKELVKVDYKEFANTFTDSSHKEVTYETNMNTNTVLTPKYNVKVEIVKPDGTKKDYLISEGQNLNSLGSETVAEIEKLVKADDKEFTKKFTDNGNNEVAYGTAIDKNTTLTPKYTVDVVIGDKTYTVDEGTSLQQLKTNKPTVTQDLENIKDNSKQFSRFADTYGNTVEDTTVFSKNTEITPIYNIKVQVEKADGTIEELAVEEGQTLNNLSNENKAKLQAIKDNHGEGWRFAKFVNAETGEEIGENTPINENIVIKPVYEEIPATGEITSSEENSNEAINPKTSDNILNFVALGLIGLACIVISIIAYRRKNK